jgi:type I restriction enzyme, S subunit
MSNWMKMNQLCVRITDGSHFSPTGKHSGYPMLSVKDMRDNGFSYDECKLIAEEDYLSLVKSDCKPLLNDVLIAKDGSYLKHVFVIEEERHQVILSSIGILRPNQRLVNPFYIKYYLHSDFVKKEVSKKYVSGSALPRIILKNFGEIQVPYVEKNRQDKIVDVLKSFDSKIELNNRINAELEAMAKLIYNYWFVQFDFPDENGKPYKSSGGRMVWNEDLRREIPKGWKVDILSDVVDLIIDHRGKTPLKLGGDWADNGEGIIALSAKHVKSAKLLCLDQANRVTKEMFEKWMPEKLKDGDILMTSEAPLGEFYFLLRDTYYCLSQRLFAIRANQSKVIPSYLYYELSKGNGYSQIIGSQSGSTVFGIRQSELRKIKILKPGLTIQILFDEIVRPMLTKIRNNDMQNQQLAELRDWLLPMLMNGQVNVVDAAEISLNMAAEPGQQYDRQD